MAGRQHRRARTRKRRGGTAGQGGPGSGPPQRQWREAVADARTKPGPEPLPVRPPRPAPPWHPLPLSEILILAGTVGFVIGMRRGVSSGGRVPLLLGIAVVSLGSIEVCLREHRSGFRSHTILLALLPVVVLHTVTVLVITTFARVSPGVNLGVVVVDLALFVLLFRLLRVRYGEARYRTLSGPRRARP
jgi:hypothetical protein